MDSSVSSNALIQDNYEGLIEKNNIHMQRKNYSSGNIEEKQLCDIRDDVDMIWDVDCKWPRQCNY